MNRMLYIYMNNEVKRADAVAIVTEWIKYTAKNIFFSIISNDIYM